MRERCEQLLEDIRGWFVGQNEGGLGEEKSHEKLGFSHNRREAAAAVEGRGIGERSRAEKSSVEQVLQIGNDELKMDEDKIK